MVTVHYGNSAAEAIQTTEYFNILGSKSEAIFYSIEQTPDTQHR